MKECNRCNKYKEESEFISMRTGTTKKCKSCRETANKAAVKRLEKRRIVYPALRTVTIERRKEALLRGNNVCSKCTKEKSLSEFKIYRQYKKGKGSSNMCHDCKRLMWRFCELKQYGLTKSQFLKLYEKQNKSCAICDIPLEISGTEKMRATTLCVDHCHDTGKVRGLLCNSCNRGLGFLGDKPELLYSAYQYLIAHLKPEELLETPEVDNQQPSLELNTL